jgi:glutamate--cysteine ligase
MDIDPYEDVGIHASTMRMLDVFLLHCLLSDSPPDSPLEIADLKHNQHLTAERGREPGLRLVRAGREVEMTAWADEVLQACRPIAQALDQVHGTQDYTDALELALARVQDSSLTPSARVLADMAQHYGNNFNAFGLARSQWARDQLLHRPWSAADEEQFAAWAAESVQAQQAIEAASVGSFEDWRQNYMAPQQLG